jgi:hypothetical protein
VITLLRFRRLEHAVKACGYASDIEWAEQLSEPADADEFARAAAYVIVNSGMKNTVAAQIFARCVERLDAGKLIRGEFKHAGKSRAINAIWKQREQLFRGYCEAEDKVAFCATLPWVGPVTSLHLAKDLGANLAKPDVHLVRLARRDRTTVERMCRRLASQSGYRIATVDTILWRACEQGILNSRVYENEGWRAAFTGRVKIQQ